MVAGLVSSGGTLQSLGSPGGLSGSAWRRGGFAYFLAWLGSAGSAHPCPPPKGMGAGTVPLRVFSL